MPQIIFLTLFLGLTSGVQTVTVQTTQDAKSVRIELGRQLLATIDHPPWSARVDLGSDIVPRELTAIALDTQGDEIARTTQILNLPRPIAELEIVLSSADGQLSARLAANHRMHSAPRRATLSVDGKSVRLGRDFQAQLPRLDWQHTHVISAEMRFQDGTVARRETVVQGGFADSTSAQLTPVVVTGDPDRFPPSLDGCFSLEGNPAKASAIEKTNALVIFVKDPDATDAMDALHTAMPVLDGFIASGHWVMRDNRLLSSELKLDIDSTERVMWPVAQHYATAGQPAYDLFAPSDDVRAFEHGVAWMLARRWQIPPDLTEPRRFADAVAVAGIAALTEGRRRAVVLVLSNTPDRSENAPASVRRYLETVGVPLFVWSVAGPRPDLASTWGEVEDIATPDGLTTAVAKLNRTLLAQRIAWIAADPLSALHVRVDEHCGVRALAHTAAEPSIPTLPKR